LLSWKMSPTGYMLCSVFLWYGTSGRPAGQRDDGGVQEGQRGAGGVTPYTPRATFRSFKAAIQSCHYSSFSSSIFRFLGHAILLESNFVSVGKGYC
jgi:hypothetical protein